MIKARKTRDDLHKSCVALDTTKQLVLNSALRDVLRGTAVNKLTVGNLLALVVFALLVFAGDAALAKNATPMTNQDVINLVHAKIAQDSIVLAIERSKPEFDTSANALIQLNKEGVPDTVVQAMIRAEDQPASVVSNTPAAQYHSASFNPEEVVLLDGSQRITMHYISPEVRTAARGLGFGGVGAYAVLRGSQAALRVTSKQPVFLVAVPNNAQPQTYFTLATFVVRNNGTREVSIGGGFMSYSSGIPKDRTIAVKYEQQSDQSHAPSGFTIYSVTPVAPLSDGEYAMVVHSSQAHVTGIFAGGTADSFFDFRIGGPG